MQGVPKKKTTQKVSSGFGDDSISNLESKQNNQNKDKQNLNAQQEQSVLNLLNKLNTEMTNNIDDFGIDSFLSSLGQQKQKQHNVDKQNKEQQYQQQQQSKENSGYLQQQQQQKSGKVSSGSVNPEFKEYVIKPRKWVSSTQDENQDNSNNDIKKIQNLNEKQQQKFEVKESGQGLENKTATYTLKKIDFENIDKDLEKDEQFDGILEISDKLRIENEKRKQYQEDILKQQQLQKLDYELKQIEKDKQQQDKVYQMQKQVMELIMEKERENIHPGSDNLPSSQLEMYKYFNQMQKEEEENAKKQKDQQNANYYTPKLFMKEKRKQEIQQQTQEALDKIREQQRISHIREISQQQDDQQQYQDEQHIDQNQHDFGDEEQFNGDKETNDSSEYQNQVLQEISREIIQEKTDKKEAVYKIAYNNEDVYEGEINPQSNLKDGWGTYYFQNGEKYEGFFDDDVIHGYGRYFFLGGHKYEGDWDQGTKCGVGELYYSNGDYYVGQFYNDSYHGEGKLVYKNGDVFEGRFQNGKKHGKGIFSGFGKTGRKIIGEWENDELMPF